MKKILSIVLLLALVFAISCKEDKEDSEFPSIIGTWKMNAVEVVEAKPSQLKPLIQVAMKDNDLFDTNIKEYIQVASTITFNSDGTVSAYDEEGNKETTGYSLEGDVLTIDGVEMGQIHFNGSNKMIVSQDVTDLINLIMEAQEVNKLGRIDKLVMGISFLRQ